MSLGGAPASALPGAASAAEHLRQQARQAVASGRLAAAVGHLETLIGRHGGQALDHYNLGLAHARLGDGEAAVRCYRAALAHDPGLEIAANNLGAALLATGRPDAAAELYQDWIERSATAANNLAMIRLQQGDRAAARVLLERLVERRPDYLDGWINLAEVERVDGRPEAALDRLDRALRLSAAHAVTRTALGRVLQDLGRPEEAAAQYRQALAEDPDLPAAHVNLGVLEQQSGQNDRAAAHYRAVLARQPAHAQVLGNLAGLLIEEGDLAAALGAAEAALAADPAQADARWNRSIAKLSLGDYPEGYQDYDARWQPPAPDSRARRFDAPLWDGGSDLPGELLLWGEQGIGDELAYAALLPDLLPRLGAGGIRCRLECDPRLTGLLARAFPELMVIGRRTPPDAAVLDAGIAAQSSTLRLPKFMRRSWTEFPDRRGFLAADPDRTALARAALQTALPGRGPKVGIAWTSGNPRTAGRKAVPLRELEPLLRLPGMQFVSLQYGPVDQELADLRAAGIAAPAANPLATDLRDPEMLAAQIAALDAVVSISGVTAHMAGALGRPGLVLLPPGPLWYWCCRRPRPDGERAMREGRESLWYPSLRLFQRRADMPWSAVVDQAAATLGVMLADGAR